MARQDAGKWVARAGATGGGRTYRARVPYRWYSGLALIVVLGVFLVAYSRYERLHPAQPVAADHEHPLGGRPGVRPLRQGPADTGGQPDRPAGISRALFVGRRRDPDPAEELCGRGDQRDAREVHLAVQGPHAHGDVRGTSETARVHERLEMPVGNT